MKDGEYVCYKCNGTGNINEAVNSNYYYTCLVKCPICKGTGILDWISNIIEPQNNGKLEVDIIVRPIKPIDMIELDFVIGKGGIVKIEQKKSEKPK